MDRLTAMLERLPPPYEIGAGSVLHQLLSVVDLQLRIFDEEMDRVQRSHWVDHAFDRGDLAKLGALFAVSPGSWEPDDLFRARLKATIVAMLQGSVTRTQLERVLVRILTGAQQALGTRYMELRPVVPGGRANFPDGPGADPPRAEFVEFPDRIRRSPELLDRRGLVRPLETFTVVNDGIDPTVVEMAITGVAGGRTAMPVLVNRTNGAAIGFRGLVPAGHTLVLRTGGDTVSARLEGRDVGDRVISTQAFAPGPGRPDPSLDEVARLPRLERGANTLWFISLARYDDPGLDAAMFGVAEEALHQGRFATSGVEGGGRWDDAVFFADPAAGIDAWWVERTPATFRFDIPAGVVRREAGRRADPEGDRTELFRLLGETVDRLRAAATVGTAAPVRLRETQPAADRLTVLAPISTTERGSAGEPVLVGTGMRFDTTARDESRYD